ncbi:MAG: class I SAM-dependent methyltransferase [Ignavibacteriae bacterium]|nr:class I SAM-dependent methyltransferase [Ignavibacteriota bacterium]
MKNYCPLCNSYSEIFYQFKKRLYYQCNNCLGIFVDKKLIPNRDAEIKRYKEHKNDVNDENYQSFVSPITSAIMRDFSQESKGLDFGAGTGPVISKILKDNNFKIALYDPLFHNYPNILESQYNYIACCEVIEHFHSPPKEFSLLKNLLMQNGKLYCMTSLYDKSIDFHNWNYKNDLTHVFIYQEDTTHWIKKNFGFSKVLIEGRLISFYN